MCVCVSPEVASLSLSVCFFVVDEINNQKLFITNFTSFSYYTDVAIAPLGMKIPLYQVTHS
jgi:hypothetical protein